MMMIWASPYYTVLAVAIVTNYIPVMVVLMIITYVLMLGGIIVTSLYVSQAMFIFVEAPDKGVFQCIRESAQADGWEPREAFFILI